MSNRNFNCQCKAHLSGRLLFILTLLKKNCDDKLEEKACETDRNPIHLAFSPRPFSIRNLTIYIYIMKNKMWNLLK